MKKYILTLALFLTAVIVSFAQTKYPLVSECLTQAGTNGKYLKDFKIQLGKADKPAEHRFKTNMSLWKNTKYRFTMCNSAGSKGQLILSIRDNNDKEILSSFDPKSGKLYPFVDFECNKSGIYELNYDFTNGQKGSAIAIVSMVK